MESVGGGMDVLVAEVADFGLSALREAARRGVGAPAEVYDPGYDAAPGTRR